MAKKLADAKAALQAQEHWEQCQRDAAIDDMPVAQQETYWDVKNHDDKEADEMLRATSLIHCSKKVVFSWTCCGFWECLT